MDLYGFLRKKKLHLRYGYSMNITTTKKKRKKYVDVNVDVHVYDWNDAHHANKLQPEDNSWHPSNILNEMTYLTLMMTEYVIDWNINTRCDEFICWIYVSLSCSALYFFRNGKEYLKKKETGCQSKEISSCWIKLKFSWRIWIHN